MQKGFPNTPRNRKKKLIDMATLRRQMRSRTGSSRQDRGSCSSTASCPVFSGPYSDHEEDPPLRRQSSPLLKGSLSSLQNSASESLKGSVSSLQGSDPCLPGSLPSLRGSLASFKEPLSNLKGSISRLKRRSLGSLDNSSPILSERSISPSLQSRNGSSSDDDNSWDTNSWSSGATCLRRTPMKEAPPDELGASGEKPYNTNQEPDNSMDEPEIIYQNLIFKRPAAKTENKEGLKRTFVTLKKDAETQSFASFSLSKNLVSAPSQHWDKNTEHRRKFSQFLNEVSVRVLKTNNGTPQQHMTLRHRYPSPPPPPPSTPSHSSLTTTLHSPPPHRPPVPATTNWWYSPTNSNLQTIKECASKEITNSIHNWSKKLPSCKILEPGDVLQKVTVENLAHPEHDLELCTKLQAQSSTGRLYLETDIDRVRQLDELVSNGSLGKERNKKELDTVEREKEREKRRETPWERDRGAGRGTRCERGSEKLCWEKDKRNERGRVKEKKAVPNSYEHSAPPLPPPPQIIASGQSNPCPTFSWAEGFPRLSYRSTSLPRQVNVTVSTTVTTRSSV